MSVSEPKRSAFMALKHVDGARPKKPLNIKQKQDTDRLAVKRKYEESTRERGFLEKWREGRPWLVFEKESAIMYCSTCREANIPPELSVFVTGTKSLRLDGIKIHDTCDCHGKAVSRLNAKKVPIEKSEAGKSLTILKKHEHEQYINLARNAHAVAKHGLSFKTYEVFCRLDQVKGLDKEEMYKRSDKGCADFTKSIAKTVRHVVLEKISNAEFVSFTCDGTTDFTGDDMESLYVRTVCKGIVHDSFLSIGTAESGGSEDIYNYIIQQFNSLHILKDMERKLVGFCADGASNMQGHKTGLAARLRVKWPHIFVIHCLAHRLELAYKDAVKKTSASMYDKATALLLGLYYLYKKSPKEKKGLERAFEALQVKQILPTRIGGTRWLPHIEN